MEQVFPAYAGVILKDELDKYILNRVPRVCGGDPSGIFFKRYVL